MGKKLFKEYKVRVNGSVYEISHTEQRKNEIVGILKTMYGEEAVTVEKYNHYADGWERKNLERIIENQLKEYAER